MKIQSIVLFNINTQKKSIEGKNIEKTKALQYDDDHLFQLIAGWRCHHLLETELRSQHAFNPSVINTHR